MVKRTYQPNKRKLIIDKLIYASALSLDLTL